MLIEIEVVGTKKRLWQFTDKLGPIVKVRTKYDEKKPTIEEVTLDLSDHHGKIDIRKGGK